MLWMQCNNKNNNLTNETHLLNKNNNLVYKTCVYCVYLPIRADDIFILFISAKNMVN